MANVNKTILIGRLGNTPELRHTPSNRAVTELRLAVSKTWTDRAGGEKMERTDWFSVDVWDKQAENCTKYLQKGREVYVEGHLSIDEWNDKETQQKRTKVKITADHVQFIGGAKNEGPARPADTFETAAAAQPSPGGGDEPF